VEPPPGYMGPSLDGPTKKRQKLDDSGGDLSSDEGRNKATVFLSNLDFEVDEDAISTLMGKSGRVKEVRLVKKPDGKSKGYAFVEFSSAAEADAAKKRDNELLEGRPLYISECDPTRKKGPVFKYSSGLDKNKLFIKGLDFAVTKEDLHRVFGAFGKLADVRLVTYRNGHSKGIAFVEYAEEVAAAKALVKTDGMKIKDKEIEVAISNPPRRKEETPADIKSIQGSDVRSLGGTTQQKDFGPRGKGRSQLAFMPRSVATSNSAAGKLGNKKLDLVKFVKPGGGKVSKPEMIKPADGSNGSGSNGSAATNAEATEKAAKEEAAPAKSNDDFRKMLLGSK